MRADDVEQPRQASPMPELLHRVGNDTHAVLQKHQVRFRRNVRHIGRQRLFGAVCLRSYNQVGDLQAARARSGFLANGHFRGMVRHPGVSVPGKRY